MSISQPTSRCKPSSGLEVIYVQVFNFMDIGPRYAVAISTSNITRYKEQMHLTAFAAWLEAAALADERNATLDVPVEIKGRLVAYWTRRGKLLFAQDKPRAMCKNQTERQAYDYAEANVDAYISEKDNKPGLTDYVPMMVRPADYPRVMDL